MLRYLLIACSLGCTFSAFAASDAELEKIRAEILQMKQSYEARIQALEARLQQAESRPTNIAPSPAAAPVQTAANAFNPEINLILSGTYAHLSQDPDNYRITGFIPGGEIGPGKRSFSLAESELNLSANIDPYFRGSLTLAITPENEVEVEEANIQTLGLGRGFTLKAGRFFSGIGYLNERHAHTWDFVDNPLAYKAFLGNQYGEDGVQLRWLAPTDTFLEFGAELGRGANFPGAERNRNSAGAAALFAHVGGDLGVSHSWRAGLSYLRNKPRERTYEETDLNNATVNNSFSGSSRLWIGDFVWKWAPQGNAKQQYAQVQGEYLRRRESGELTYDTDATALADAYRATQSGWYVQGVYQFMPKWRVGLRRDQLYSGRVDYALNNANLARPDYRPSKNSLMFDYKPSEFSRLRLQFAQDKSRQGVTDNQVFLQYIMSLGAHGAHQF